MIGKSPVYTAGHAPECTQLRLVDRVSYEVGSAEPASPKSSPVASSDHTLHGVPVRGRSWSFFSFCSKRPKSPTCYTLRAPRVTRGRPLSNDRKQPLPPSGGVAVSTENRVVFSCLPSRLVNLCPPSRCCSRRPRWLRLRPSSKKPASPTSPRMSWHCGRRRWSRSFLFLQSPSSREALAHRQCKAHPRGRLWHIDQPECPP